MKFIAVMFKCILLSWEWHQIKGRWSWTI